MKRRCFLLGGVAALMASTAVAQQLPSLPAQTEIAPRKLTHEALKSLWKAWTEIRKQFPHDLEPAKAEAIYHRLVGQAGGLPLTFVDPSGENPDVTLESTYTTFNFVYLRVRFSAPVDGKTDHDVSLWLSSVV